MFGRSGGYSSPNADAIASKMKGLLGSPARYASPGSSLQPETEEPGIYGYGPLMVSSCTDLEGPLPLHIWDVNGYYRELGVDSRATRKELMRAYQKFGHNPSARVTYIFKQLLDPVVRRQYDLQGLGEIFLDNYVTEALHRRVKLEMARRMAQQAQDRERDIFAPDGPDIDYEEVLQDMGFRVVPDEEVDNDSEDGLTATSPTQWGYSYYRWKSHADDVERLATWQEHVVTALIRKGVKTKIAVGYCGRMAHPYVVGVIGNLPVAFLNDREQPDPALADRAADRVVEATAQIALRG